MKLTATEISEIRSIVEKSLDRAEKMWESTLGISKYSSALVESMDTNIPGHSKLRDDEYTSDEFIAMMVDMRDSTKHLRQAISGRTAKVSLMQRVFYEVSALLPAITKPIQDENGSVVEYLGDGALALFQLPKELLSRNRTIYAACKAARKSMDCLEKCINPSLQSRYSLPPLEIGVGLAYSDAIITRFGLYPNTQAKVIGTCIYNASKLSKGRNQIHVHDDLERIWPSIKTGAGIRFSKRNRFVDVDGFLLEENNG